MKFDDPLELECSECATTLKLPLRDVVGLTARCPSCGHSLREHGLAMRRHANAMTGFFVTWETVWIFEARYDFIAPDDDVASITTPRALVQYVQARSGGRATKEEVLAELASRIRRPLDASHLDALVADLVPDPLDALG